MKAKKLIAAFMAMAISCGAVHTANYCSPGRFLVSAEDESLVWLGGMYYDEESKILYINGKIGAESIRSLRDNPNIHGVQALDGAVLPEDCSYMFGGFSNSKFIDLSKADASNVKTMKGMFSGYNHWGEGYDNVGSINISGLDTSNVTDMSYMFSGSNTVASMEGLDTSNVTDMSYMYSGNKSEYLSPGAIDTSNVTSIKGMFKGTDTNYLDLYHFDTSKVTDMSEMFMNCCHYDSLSIRVDEPALIYNKTAPVLCGFDTSKVTDMSNMFSGCGFDSLDLTSFDTSNVTDMSGMFNESVHLKEIK
ncbi:BspA family leucine-rich repeat surface protein, partial [Ruminococcus flavefaciens]|uniref:BspA family leucine-rich repeat surface protein n=1 Tax=Ruminococcus flavefaciens TaxID=1265 RepID=UPI00035C308A